MAPFSRLNCLFVNYIHYSQINIDMRNFKGFSTVGKTHGSFKLYDIELVKQDLLNEFYTKKGSRLMSPQFGSIIWDLLFDPLTDDTLELVKEDCVRIVGRDPRLELLDVSTYEEDHTIQVTLQLRYVPTTTLTELVLTYQRDISAEQNQG